MRVLAMIASEAGRRGGEGVESKHYYYLLPILPQLLLPGELHLVNDGQGNPLLER